MLRRILIVGNFLSSHGRVRGVCEELAPRLRELGWTVVATSSCLFRPARLIDMLWTVWRQRHHYDLAQVDVYSGPSFRWAEAVCGLLRNLNRPYILTLHGGGLPEFARRKNRRVRALLDSAAAVTVPSEYLLDRMSNYRRDLKLLPNAVDLRCYPLNSHKDLQPRLIWLRAFHEIYNPCMVPRVLARLKDEFPSIRLTMAGPDKGDSSREATIATAKKYGVEAHLEFKGLLPKACVSQLLRTGDIFLNTSTVDNAPVSLLEAMAAGLCVVSTDAGGIPYLVKSGKEALLVPVDDDAAMAAAVRRLLMDQQLVARIRTASLAKANMFDWSMILPQWEALLAIVADGARAPTQPWLRKVPRTPTMI